MLCQNDWTVFLNLHSLTAEAEGCLFYFLSVSIFKYLLIFFLNYKWWQVCDHFAPSRLIKGKVLPRITILFPRIEHSITWLRDGTPNHHTSKHWVTPLNFYYLSNISIYFSLFLLVKLLIYQIYHSLGVYWGFRCLNFFLVLFNKPNIII